MMIILNGLHKKFNKLTIIFFILSISVLFAEEIEVLPLVNLDEIEPSYDEEIISNDIDNFSLSYEKRTDDTNLRNKPKAVVNILNKVTTDVEQVHISLKKDYFYQELRIYAIDCYISTAEERSEIAVYLNIYHLDTKDKIFNGWMLKSLPSISSMEHPIYDIWVEDCV